MNIFVLDEDPVLSAQAQCDKHIVKMPLETAQMLCSHFEPGEAPYKRAHYNHPCTRWARESADNYIWLVEHGIALCKEYTYRYNKRHKSQDVIDWCSKHVVLESFPVKGITKFAQAMFDEYKHESAVQAYRNYYRGAKKDLLVYTRRAPPVWVADLATWKSVWSEKDKRWIVSDGIAQMA